MPLRSDMPKRLAQLRVEHGYSQEALANELGISRQAVSRWECGDSSPDVENLVALSDLYGISLDSLVRGDVSPDSGANEEPPAEQQASATGLSDSQPSSESTELESKRAPEHRAEQHEASTPHPSRPSTRARLSRWARRHRTFLDGCIGLAFLAVCSAVIILPFALGWLDAGWLVAVFYIAPFAIAAVVVRDLLEALRTYIRKNRQDSRRE